MRSLVLAFVCLTPALASAQEYRLAIGAEPTTTGGLRSEVVLEQLLPALPRVTDCYRGRPEAPRPLRLSFDPAGVPSTLGPSDRLEDCLHIAVSGMRVGVAPPGARRMALVRLVVFGREVVPPAPPGPSPPPAPSQNIDEGLIIGLALGAGAVIGGVMMGSSLSLAEEDRGYLFWPGLVLAAPGLAIASVVLLIHLALED